METRPGIEALKRCVEILGSQTAVGEIVGRTQTAISECILNGQRVPAEWCIPLEHATRDAGKTVSRHELRPDIYPIEDGKRAALVHAEQRARNPQRKAVRG